MTTGAQGRTNRWPRFFRGWAAAGFATFVAALSHTLGGGGIPSPLAVVVALAFAGIICIGLAGRSASLWRTALSVLASQLVFHGLFALAGTGDRSSATLVDPAPAGVHQHVLHLSVVGAGPGMSHVVHGTGWAMWAAHGIAAVVTILALRRGERALATLWAIARLVVCRLFPRLAAAILPAVPRQTIPSVPVVAPRPADILLASLWHRGPPECAVLRTPHLTSA